MVDPILSLTIAIAEVNKAYAIFLGSGVSKTAGIPTGPEILWDSKKLLYKLINEKEPKDKELKDWFEKSKFKDFTYSKILKAICSSQEERRKFLEKYFIGRSPTDTHRIIADMVKKGLTKIVITTNFDRLMEKALDDAEIVYDVASSSAELKAMRPREQSPCSILKLHGDYQSSEIKNTEQELAKLEPGIEAEFQEILDRYGIVVMGYSGLDEGVMRCFEKRSSKYTLYWLRVGDINERVKKLLNQQEGKLIVREDSGVFLKELARKIDIFSFHETGDTPDFLMQLTKQFIREDDEVGFWEEVKKQLGIIRKSWQDVHAEAKGDCNKAIHGLKRLEVYSDGVLCMGLVLIEYGRKKYFRKILSILQEIYDLAHVFRNGYRSVIEIPFAVIHNIFYSWGTLALRKEQFDMIKELINYGIMERGRGIYKNILLNSSVFCSDTLGSNSIKAFEFLTKSFTHKEFAKEYFHSEDDFLNLLCEFNCLLNIYTSAKNLQTSYGKNIIIPIFAKYYPHRVQGFTLRMKLDSNFSKAISEKVFEEKIETFIENYPSRCTDINKIQVGERESRLDTNLFIKNSSTGILEEP